MVLGRAGWGSWGTVTCERTGWKGAEPGDGGTGWMHPSEGPAEASGDRSGAGRAWGSEPCEQGGEQHVCVCVCGDENGPTAWGPEASWVLPRASGASVQCPRAPSVGGSGAGRGWGPCSVRWPPGGVRGTKGEVSGEPVDGWSQQHGGLCQPSPVPMSLGCRRACGGVADGGGQEQFHL